MWFSISESLLTLVFLLTLLSFLPTLGNSLTCAVGSDKSSAQSQLASLDSSILLLIDGTAGSQTTDNVYLGVRVLKEDALQTITLLEGCSFSPGDYVAVSLKTELVIPQDFDMYSISLVHGTADNLCVDQLTLYDETAAEFVMEASGLDSSHYIPERGCLDMSSSAADCWNMLGASDLCTCEPGHVFDGSACSACLNGTYETISTCTNCVKGKYAMTSATVCSDCGLGKFNDLIQQSECKECGLGRFSPIGGQSTCFGCETGRFANTRGNSQCELCSSNTYSDVSGSSQCKTCPTSSQSSQASKSLTDCFCPSSYYGAAFLGDTCSRCPGNRNEIVCGANSSVASVDDGWYFVNFPDPDSLIKCEPEEACKQNVETGQTVCTKGYSGEVCSQCEDGYFKVSSRCQPCPDYAWGLTVLLFILFCAFCFAIVKSSDALQRKAHSIGIWISWVQILSLYSALPVQWPSSVLSLYDAASSSNMNFELFSPGCSASLSFWNIWYLKLSFPFLFGGSIGLIYLCQLSLRIVSPEMPAFLATQPNKIMQWIESGDERFLEKHDPNFPGRYMYAFTLMLTYCYTLLASVTVNPLNCVKSADGIWRMLYNQEVICYEGYWLHSVLPTVIVASTIYLIGIPMTVGYILHKYKGKTDTKEFLDYFGGLTLPYRNQYQWFELVNMLRKASVAIFVDFFFVFQSAYMQLFATITVTFIFLILQFFLAPYKLPFNNSLSFLWICVSMFCLFTGLVFINPNVSNWEINFFAILVYLIFMFACVVSVKVFVEEIVYYKNYNKNIHKDSGVKSVVERANTRVKQLLDIFPRSYRTISNHIALLSVEQQEKFYSDCFDITRFSDSNDNQIRTYQSAAARDSHGRTASIDGIPVIHYSPQHSRQSSDSKSLVRSVSHRGIDDIPFANRISPRGQNSSHRSDDSLGLFADVFGSTEDIDLEQPEELYDDVEQFIRILKSRPLPIGRHGRSMSLTKMSELSSATRLHRRNPSISSTRKLLGDDALVSILLKKPFLLREAPPLPSKDPPL